MMVVMGGAMAMDAVLSLHPVILLVCRLSFSVLLHLSPSSRIAFPLRPHNPHPHADPHHGRFVIQRQGSRVRCPRGGVTNGVMVVARAMRRLAMGEVRAATA